ALSRAGVRCEAHRAAAGGRGGGDRYRRLGGKGEASYFLSLRQRASSSLSLRERAGVRGSTRAYRAPFLLRPHPNPLPEGEGTKAPSRRERGKNALASCGSRRSRRLRRLVHSRAIPAGVLRGVERQIRGGQQARQRQRVELLGSLGHADAQRRRLVEVRDGVGEIHG